MGMPFGMIFAIFLIVVFVVIAFMAVDHFLDLGQSASVGMFYEDLQGAVDDAVRNQESDSDFVINLPGDTEQDILDLEVAGFLKLVQQPGTLARLEHMLKTGKPLRN